jgi:hypothetical protein
VVEKFTAVGRHLSSNRTPSSAYFAFSCPSAEFLSGSFSSGLVSDILSCQSVPPATAIAASPRKLALKPIAFAIHPNRLLLRTPPSPMQDCTAPCNMLKRPDAYVPICRRVCHTR